MPPSDKPYHGGHGGAFGAEGNCPSNAYLSGITQSYTVSENENQFLNSLEMTCTKMTDGSSVNICLETGHGCSGERSSDASAQEIQLSKPIEQHCPKGEAVAGIRGRSGQFVDALGLICKPISGGRSAWKEYLSRTSFDELQRSRGHANTLKSSIENTIPQSRRAANTTGISPFGRLDHCPMLRRRRCGASSTWATTHRGERAATSHRREL